MIKVHSNELSIQQINTQALIFSWLVVADLVLYVTLTSPLVLPSTLQLAD